MPKIQWIVRALRTAGVVCLLCIPYTDLRVDREPKALGDHLFTELPADPMGALNPMQAAAMTAPGPADAAALPMQAILRKLPDAALNIFFLSMDRLVNLNQEVFDVLVDKLPALSENAETDKMLREELKREFRKSAALYGPKPQQVLARAAMQVLMERLDQQQLAQLMQAQTAAEQKMLLEKLLRDRLNAMDPMNPFAGMQAPMGMGGGMGGHPGRGAMGENRPAPAAADDRRFKDLRALTTPKTDTAAPVKKEEPKASTPTPARSAMKDDEDTKAAAPIAKAPNAPTGGTQQSVAAPKKTLLPGIAGSPGTFNSPAASSAAASSGMMPIQAGVGNSGSASSASDFAFSPTADTAFARQKFNYTRANPYLGSNGEEAGESYSEGSEIAVSTPNYSGAVSGALGAPSASSSSLTSGPAFSKPMELTLSGLCASGALNCDRQK